MSFSLFLDFWLILNHAVITKVFNRTAELLIPTGITTTEVKTEMETQSVIVEVKISKYLV